MVALCEYPSSRRSRHVQVDLRAFSFQGAGNDDQMVWK